MPESYTILPSNTLATVTSAFTSGIADNIVPIIGVVAFGAVVAFVWRKFNRGVKGVGR